MRSYRFMIGAVVTLLATFAGSPVVLAEHTTFKQKILPLDCVFEVIDVGLGTIKYLTPEECGQIITPPHTGQPGSGGSPETPQSPSIPDIIPGFRGYGPTGTPQSSGGRQHVGTEQTILLDDIRQARSRNGYVVTVRLGDQLRYHPLFGSDTSVERTITITGLNQSGITLLFSPMNQIEVLRILQNKSYDYEVRQKPRLNMEYLSSPTSDSAMIRVRLLQERLVSQSKPAHTNEFYYIAIAILVAIIITNMFVRNGRLHSMFGTR